MQFLGIIGFLILAIFLGSFLYAGLSDALKNTSFSFPTNYGYGGYQEASAINTTQEKATGIKTSPPIPVYEGDDIVSILNDVPNTSRFRQLFEETNGARFLVEPTLYTLFVPTDAAFAALAYPEQVLVNTMDVEETVRFVTNHMVPQKMVAVGGQKLGTATAISREYLNFELYENSGSVGNAHVVAIYNADNGIVYVIDGVLLPPQKTLPPVHF